MKRAVHLSATDHDLKVTIRATIDSRNGLSRGEVDRIKQSLTRNLADAVTHLPYSDFGIENTNVR